MKNAPYVRMKEERRGTQLLEAIKNLEWDVKQVLIKLGMWTLVLHPTERLRQHRVTTLRYGLPEANRTENGVSVGGILASYSGCPGFKSRWGNASDLWFCEISHCHRLWPDYWVVTGSILINSNFLISNYSKLLRGSVSMCALK